MGALEFFPEVEQPGKDQRIQFSSLISLAQRIYNERENFAILPEESLTLQSLLAVGTSVGGRQPKAIIAINRDTGEMCSGQIANHEGLDYYILKFGNPAINSAEIEMSYYKLAIDAGIRMMPCELRNIDGYNHFLTKRFDRERGHKLHTQTLAAISPGASSYEELLSVCRKLRLPEADCHEVYRRMIFNILANNTDDHNKNFSFVMNRDGEWRLSPAYDLTYIVDTAGYIADVNHCMFMRAKLRDFTLDDALAFAHDNGIRRPELIIHEVASSLRNIRSVATQYDVSPLWIGRIENTIYCHLKKWGEITDTTDVASLIDGHVVKDISVALAHKGNYHLVADIDGQLHQERV